MEETKTKMHNRQKLRSNFEEKKSSPLSGTNAGLRGRALPLVPDVSGAAGQADSEVEVRDLRRAPDGGKGESMLFRFRKKLLLLLSSFKPFAAQQKRKTSLSL